MPSGVSRGVEARSVNHPGFYKSHVACRSSSVGAIIRSTVRSLGGKACVPAPRKVIQRSAESRRSGKDPAASLSEQPRRQRSGCSVGSKGGMSVRTASETRAEASVQQVAFFDVDGTLAKSNLVLPFVMIRLANLNFFAKLLWVPFFALKCIFYILLDQVDRTLFNKVFYKNYAGQSTAQKDAMAKHVHSEYMHPRIFEGARQHIQHLKDQGMRIVFVTGSLDFLMDPLAQELGAEDVIAAKLEEQDGMFTGNLEGPAVANEQKAVAMREYARERNLDLAQCQAYGDSYADMAMLEAVGSPFVVRPSKRLGDIAKTRGWPVMDW